MLINNKEIPLNQADRKRSAFFMMHKNCILLLLLSLTCRSQWTHVSIPTTSSFRALKVYGKHIWTSGTNGTVGHSSDAGKTWKFQQIPEAENLDFRDLAIINNQVILLMSAGPSEEGKAKLFQTKDGGNTWAPFFQIKEKDYFFDCIQWDKKNKLSWLLSDPINQKLTLFKYDQKKLSQIESANTPLLKLNEAFFAASGSSMQLVNNQLVFVGGGADSARIYTYDIRMNTWKANLLNIATGEAKGYFSIATKNKNEFMAVGGDYRKLNELTIPVIKTSDGGNQWQAIDESPSFYMEKVIWAKPYWIVSGPSQSAVYHDKKKQWRSLGKSPYHNIIQTGNTIWGIGAKGQLGYMSLSSMKNLFLPKEQ